MSAYDILDLLGEGSTATVHRARRTGRAGQIVALKASRRDDRAAAEALRAEGEALGAIDHPNVVRLLDVVDDGTTVTLALQLAAGGSLAHALANRTWNEADVMTAARELASALAECHRTGIVHGDVATTNVLLGADGSVLLADFGSRSGASGTEGFVAPEVAAGASATTASDVFGLGKVLECLAAAAPHDAVSAAACRATASDPAVRPSARDVVSLLHRPAEAVRRAPERQVPRTQTFRPTEALPTASPAQPERPRRCPLRAAAPKMAVVLGAVMLASGLVQLATPEGAAHARPSCPSLPAAAPGAETLEADVDGDGCPNAVERHGTVVTVGSDRFVLGRPGDVLYVGDWDCDGDATPAVFRAASRRLAMFDAWPSPGAGPPAPVVTIVDAVDKPPAPPMC